MGRSVSTGGTVLVAGGDARARAGRRHALEAAGLEVIEAQTGQAVMASASRAGLVLLDPLLADMDGFQLCRRLRRAVPDVAVLFVVAPDADVALRWGVLESGGDGYAVEGESQAGLLDSVRAMLGAHRELAGTARSSAGGPPPAKWFRAAQELSLDPFTILRAVRDDTGSIADFEWEYANTAAARVLRHQAHALIGKRLLDVLPGNGPSGLFARYVRVVETGRPHDIELAYDADGIIGWFRNMAVRIGDGIAVSFRDITERKRIDAVLRQQAVDLAEANRLKDEFLATLSHELRTPLNAILGWTRILIDAPLAPAERVRALEAVERNAQAQVQIIDDVLDVSRIITGRLRVEVAPLDLVPLVESALAVARPAAEAKEIDIGVAVGRDPAWVTGDADRLRQVFWNLLSNAVKFTPPGGRVSVRVERAGREVLVSVADTGIGVSGEFLPRVFDRFSQLDGSMRRSYGGLGLGLAIVRHLVELHGGRVAAESPGEGRGATFTVWLPARPAAGDDDAARSGPASVRPLPGPGPDRR